MARTSKKKIPIYEEGVLLTRDADSLDFRGTGISGSETNDDVIEQVPSFSDTFAYPFVYIPTSPLKVAGSTTLGPELLTDPSFETWTSGTQLTNWNTSVASGTPSLLRNAAIKRTGVYSAQIIGDPGSGSFLGIEQLVTGLTSGDTLTAAIYATDNGTTLGNGGYFFTNDVIASATKIWNVTLVAWETIVAGTVWSTVFGSPSDYLTQTANSATFVGVTSNITVPSDNQVNMVAVGTPNGGAAAFISYLDDVSLKKVITVAGNTVKLYDFRNDSVLADLEVTDRVFDFGIGVASGFYQDGTGAFGTSYGSFNFRAKEVGVATATQATSATTLAQIQAGYQPLDSDLTAIAALSVNGLIKRTGTGTWAGGQSVILSSEVSGVLPVANGGTGTAVQFTEGSVVFAGASGVYTQDNTNFFWDDTNNRLGIGTATPAYAIDNIGTTNSKLFNSYLFSLGQVGAWTVATNAFTPKNYFNLGADWHGSAIYSSNVYLVDDALKVANSHSTISGTVLKIPGNGKAFQGSFIFYTAPAASVTADAVYAGTMKLLVDAATGYVGVGAYTASPVSPFTVTSTLSSATVGTTYNFATSGSGITARTGLLLSMTAGYSGSGIIGGLAFDVTAITTEASYTNDTATYGYRPGGARGAGGYVRGVTAGVQTSGLFLAGGSNSEAYGVWGGATVTRTGGYSIGVMGVAANSAGIPFAGAFVLGSRATQPVVRGTGAALLCDNGSVAADIFVALSAGSDVVKIDTNGATSIVPLAVSGGQIDFTVFPGAHTNVTAEKKGFYVRGSTQTITGSFTNFRFALFDAPTISAASALTVTTASTVTINGAVIADGSAVITNPLAFWVQAGDVKFDGTNFTANSIISNTIVRLKGYTVATLPAGTVGDTAYCTDLLAPTFFTAAVGGGAVVGPVFYNGAAWICT